MNDYYSRSSDMECPNCDAMFHGTTPLWSNQYGEEIRRFCKQCGCWWDTKKLYGDPLSTEIRILKQGRKAGSEPDA